MASPPAASSSAANGGMNGGEALVATLLSRDVDTLFFVAGGTYVTVLDALSRVRNRIRAVPTRIESAAVYAAEAYAALRKKPGCVFVSRAPGASNAAIGIHSAMQASRPVVLFIGNIPTRQKGREAFQEINYQLMFEPIAKAVFDVASFDDVADVTARALDLAVSGRPGPVVVAVSKDILDGKVGPVAIPRLAARVVSGPDPQAVAAAAARLIDEAKRPIAIAGEIVAFERASPALARFAEASGAGVMTSYYQQDVIANDHPAHFGQLGIDRMAYQKEALAAADLIVNIGSRFDSVTTADYSLVTDAHKLIMVYPEPSTFAPWRADVAIAAAVTPTLDALTRAVRTPSPDRLAWRDSVHAMDLRSAMPGEKPAVGAVDMAKVIEAFKAIVPKDSIMTSDAGTFARWVHRYYRFNVPDTCIGPVAGAMGGGIPCAIGACLADPTRPVFAWVGDGGFLMTGHETATCVQENLPVKIIVCDNNAWGSILVHQQKRFGQGGFGTLLKSPDFAMLGRGYGIPSFTVKTTAEFPAALKEAMAAPGPALVHVILDARDVSPYAVAAR